MIRRKITIESWESTFVSRRCPSGDAIAEEIESLYLKKQTESFALNWETANADLKLITKPKSVINSIISFVFSTGRKQ